MNQVNSIAESDTAEIAVDSGNGSGLDQVELKPESRSFGLSNATWGKIAIITGLMSFLFWPNLRRLWDKTNPFYGEANWGHAIAVPFISLYYLYVNRERLLNPQSPRLTAKARSLWMWGLVQIGMAMSLLWVWVYAPHYLKLSFLCVAVISASVLAFAWMGRGTNLIEEAANTSATWFGIYIVIFGIALFGYGIYPGQNDFVKDFGMVTTLFGVVLAMSGWGRMQIAWFAIAFLVCAIPWPGLVYSEIATPLQELAANVAVWTLQVTGVESSVGGTKIFIKSLNGTWSALNVAEACAGLRSLMTFIAVGGAVGFLSNRPLWQKIIVTVSAIPIAIFCNVMRVSGQGLLDRYVSHQLSESFAHQFVGMIMLIPAFLLILLVGWVLDQIFLEEIDRRRHWSPKVLKRHQGSQAVAAPVSTPSVVGRSLAAARRSPAAGATAAPSKTQPIKPAPARPATATPPPSVRLATGRLPSAGGSAAMNKPATPPSTVRRPNSPEGK